MRNFGQFCRKCLAASVLVLALACSTFAGDIQYPAVTSPPPATLNGDMQYPTVASSPDTINGDIPYPGVTIDSVTGIALSLWQGALALF
jgi:hypothetical protein